MIARSLSDPSVFAAIFDRHAATLLGYLVRRVGPADAEDLLSELFRNGFEARGRFDVERPDARPWLYGIGANLVMKHYRSRARHREAMVREAAQAIDHVADFDQRVVDDIVHRERLNAALAVLRGLPERDREVAVLYAWEELSYDEIAEALAIPVGTVRSRLNRVRTHLRELTATVGESPGVGPQSTQEVLSDE